ncbi:24-methylenesterol C-methyltransferase 2-like [Hibiscus syriacus]|uniref:24-methylenesterol C-methyltransferase 2-like n=1 Tax=Hibiscus syriacus TaxID=106335 RepID=A0A6A2ZZ01_HIBSY|nr:24-methylenesterol C-methyltransferase 2-like [Hibiscus syriacus]
MEKLSGLSHLFMTIFLHLFMTIFLHNFATFMVIPAITDVTMEALCPGRDECSLSIYISGFQQAEGFAYTTHHSTIIPLAILAYSRTSSFFYAYYVFKILTAMFCEGSVHCLALAFAYVVNLASSGALSKPRNYLDLQKYPRYFGFFGGVCGDSDDGVASSVVRELRLYSLGVALVGPVQRMKGSPSFWSVRQRRRGSTEASTTAGRDIWLGLLEAAGGVGRLKLGAASWP